MVLGLAFMTEERAQLFSFDKNTYKNAVSGALGKGLFKNYSLNKTKEE